jgi:hypothetical protein
VYSVSPADAPRMIDARPSCRGVILPRSGGTAADDSVELSAVDDEELAIVIALRCTLERERDEIGSLAHLFAAKKVRTPARPNQQF